MSKFLKIISLFLILLVGGCVEQISFPLERTDRERLIVSGMITDLAGPHTVFLSETTSNARQPLLADEERKIYTLNDLPRPVQGASVALFSEETGFVGNYFEIKPGEYQLNGRVAFPGQRYFLQIFVGNRSYRSTSQLMPESIGSDALSFEFTQTRVGNNPEVDAAVIYSDVTLPDSNEDFYLRWMVDEAFYWQLTFFPNPFNIPPPECFVFGIVDAERLTMIDGTLLQNAQSSRQLLGVRPVDESFLSLHYFNVTQLSITKEAYDYWFKVREVVNNTGSVFDSPPAPIRGNITNSEDPEEVVLGFFEVAKAKLTRISTNRSDVPFFLSDVCPFTPGRPRNQYPSTCLSCAAWGNSSNQAPSWWNEP